MDCTQSPQNLAPPARTVTPRLYRLNFAAAACGMTPRMFLIACQTGQIPVAVYQVGRARYWHVDAIQWLRWMGPLAPEGLARLTPEAHTSN